MFNRLVILLKIILPIFFVGWIVRSIWQEDPDAISDIWNREKNYPRIGCAIAICLTALTITFWRWYLLVRAIHLPFRFWDALRLGFIGNLFQYVALGTVGGDLFKAIFLAREQPDRKPEAIATIFIDRAVGLLALLILTSLAFLTFGWSNLPERLHVVAMMCFVVTVVALLIVVGLLFTTATTKPLRQLFRHVPAVPAILLRGEHALRLYRENRRSFFLALASGLVSHCLLGATAYFAATSLYEDSPTFLEQIVTWNIAGSASALPLSPGGLGTMEAAYSYLYKTVPAGGRPLEHGFAVAMLLRIVYVVVAAIGILVYWYSRREFDQLLVDAEHDAVGHRTSLPSEH